jgi:hypothetical protein
MLRFAVVLSLLTACAGSEEVVEPATLSFLTPAEGDTVAAGDVDVSLVVENFALVAPVAKSGFRFLGFFPTAWAHNDEIPQGTISLIVDDGAALSLTSTTTTLTGLAAGSHTLSAELLYEDGDALEPAVTATVTFTAE